MANRFCCTCIHQLYTGLSDLPARNIELGREYYHGFQTRSILDIPDCMNECYYRKGKPLYKSARAAIRSYYNQADRRYREKLKQTQGV